MSDQQKAPQRRDGFSRRHWRGVSLMALMVAVTCGAPAQAAEDEADLLAQVPQQPAGSASAGSASSGVEEIIVTARRRDEKAQDVPIPITVISGDALANKGTVRIEDIGRLLPSTNITYTNPRQNSVAVRGLGNNPAGEGLESSVGLFVDGVYYNRPGMGVIELTDLEQVELLRGPQGTLFGKNTTGGALNLTTKKPSFTPEVAVEGTLGSETDRQFRGSFTGGITDTQAVRVNLYDTRKDGILRGLASQDLNDRARQGIRGQWLYDDKDGFDLRLIADYHQEDDQQGASSQAFRFTTNAAKNAYLTRVANLRTASGGTLLAPGAGYDAWDRTSFANDSYQKKVHQGGSSAEANWKLPSGFNLTSISAFRRWDFRPYNDGDNLNLDLITSSGGEVLANQISQEFRLSSPTGGAIDYTTGLFYYLSRTKYESFTYYGQNAALLALYQNNGANYAGKHITTESQIGTDSYAGFGQANYHATDSLTITGGTRYTYERKNIVVDRDLDGTSSTLPNVDSQEENLKSYSLTALLAADYKLNDSVNLFTSVSHGAKAGAMNNTVGTGSPLNRENLVVRPEKINAVEAGFKSSLLDRRATLNANVYYEVVKDYQAQGQVWNPELLSYGTSLVNTGWVDTKGVEVEASYKPLPGLTLRTGLSYNLAKYRSYRNAACAPENNAPAGTPCDLSGQDVQGAPRWIGSVGADYNKEVFDGIEAYIGSDVTFRSGSFGTNDNSQFGHIDGYALVNLYTGTRLNDGQVDLQFWVRNLLDKDYVNGTGIGSGFWAGTYSANLGEPRSLGVTAKVKF